MNGQEVLPSGPVVGHHAGCRVLLSQHLRSRGSVSSRCRWTVLPRAEGGEGGSSLPGLASKPSLSRPPTRPPPPSQNQGRGNGAQDRPVQQGSGRGARRQDSFREGSAGNGEQRNCLTVLTSLYRSWCCLTIAASLFSDALAWPACIQCMPHDCKWSCCANPSKLPTQMSPFMKLCKA